MTADFFRATLAVSSYDLQEKSDHGKEEQVEEACTGKGQAPRRQEERREKESPAVEGQGKGEGQEERRGTQSREEGRQSCTQEGQAQSQSRGQEDCTQAESGAGKNRSAADSGADAGSACVAGVGHPDIHGDSQYGTVGVL